MKRIAWMLGALLVLGASASAGEIDQELKAAVAEVVAPSLVTVEFTYRYDKGEPPTQLGRGTREQYVREERPYEVPGFLVAPTTVVLPEQMIHPRFVEKIEVRSGRQVVGARSSARILSGDAWFLELEAPLRNARPLEFDATRDPPYLAITTWRSETEFALFVGPFPDGVSITESRRTFGWNSRGFTLFVDRKGGAVGMSFTREMPLDASFKGSPIDRPSMSSQAMEGALAGLAEKANAGILRVKLNFRSPREGERERFSFGGANKGTSTEKDAAGVLVNDRTVLVLLKMDPKETARLERIHVHPPEGKPVPATFAHSLKDYEALLVTLELPLPGGLLLSTESPSTYREHLILSAEVRIQGEQRTSYFQGARYDSVNLGWRRHKFPSLYGENLYLFDMEGRLIALPLGHRDPATERNRWSSHSSREMTAASYLGPILIDPARHADPNNVPVGEEEEDRLAWMGVVLQNLDRDLARANGVSDLTRDGSTGVLVSYVYPESPAAKAGVEPGDIIIRLHVEGMPKPVEVRAGSSTGFDLPDIPAELAEYMGRSGYGRPWPSASNGFTRKLTDLGFGKKYTAEVFRDGKVQRMDFVVEKGPVHYEAAPRHKSEKLGLSVRELTYEVRRYFQLGPDEPGVIVSKVEPGEKASVASIKPYEIVTHVDDKPVRSIADFEKHFETPGEKRIALKFKTKTRLVKVMIAE